MEYSQTLQLYATVAQGVCALVAVWIAFMVNKYTTRRDTVETFCSRWEETQQINLNLISNEKDIKLFEEIVHGREATVDLYQARKMFYLFIVLNQLLPYHFLLNKKMISTKEFEEHVTPTARFICRERDLIEYLLKNRGYTKDFANDVLPIIKAAIPIESYVQSRPAASVL